LQRAGKRPQLLRMKMKKSFSDSSYKPAVFADASRLEKIKATFPVIDSLYKNYAAQNHFPGIAFGLVVDGKLVFTGNQGYTDIAKQIPVTSSFIVSHCVDDQEFHRNGYFKTAR
jgi:CubicO group peptidase (beta-lactamase class C family)